MACAWFRWCAISASPGKRCRSNFLMRRRRRCAKALHAALIQWAQSAGEGSDYTDNVPMQCLHPVGHWYEVANLLRNGTLQHLLKMRPQLNI